jgi:YVTN family beta-propeller protein
VASPFIGGDLVGTAVNPTTDTVYVANQSGFSVPAINGQDNAVTATIRRRRPFGIAANPATNTTYTDSFDNTVSVISGQTNTVVATISVGSTPEGVAVNPETNTSYVTNSLSGTVSVLRYRRRG